MKGMVWWLIFLLVIPAALAGQGQMKLLAVQGTDGNYSGSSADLFLETRPGSGRVFLETYPLTKMDTQISTRFAKEIACNYFDLDCDEFDFIYTIKSTSSIVGGPSAGAAIAVLTTAVVKDLKIDKEMAITGTINSGGIVGPVGGLMEKIEAGVNIGLKTVLIPQGTREVKKDNKTIDLREYGKEKGVLVLEAADLNELVFYFTGQKLRDDYYSVEVDPEYYKIMKELGLLLCNRTTELEAELGDYKIKDAEELSRLRNKTVKAQDALDEDNYYSAASFCFGTNVQLRAQLYEKADLSDAELGQEAKRIESKLKKYKEEITNKELRTITDLQTYGVVIERLNEGLDNIKTFLEQNNTYYLAFAEERLFSAMSWAQFFKMSGKEFRLDEAALEFSCLEKIQEAKERYQYVSLFIFGDLIDLNKDIEKEEAIYSAGDYKYCLIKASQTKAEANAILSSLGVEEDKLDELLDTKLGAVERSLSRTISKGAFPILGYSYYQYAGSLREDAGLALVYSEYALELSNLDMYFEEEAEFEGIAVNPGFWIFIFGGVVGVCVVLLLYFLTLRKND